MWSQSEAEAITEVHRAERYFIEKRLEKLSRDTERLAAGLVSRLRQQLQQKSQELDSAQALIRQLKLEVTMWHEHAEDLDRKMACMHQAVDNQGSTEKYCRPCGFAESTKHEEKSRGCDDHNGFQDAATPPGDRVNHHNGLWPGGCCNDIRFHGWPTQGKSKLQTRTRASHGHSLNYQTAETSSGSRHQSGTERSEHRVVNFQTGLSNEERLQAGVEPNNDRGFLPGREWEGWQSQAQDLSRQLGISVEMLALCKQELHKKEEELEGRQEDERRLHAELQAMGAREAESRARLHELVEEMFGRLEMAENAARRQGASDTNT
ncbi:protein ZNF365 [Petromyzon marinus]|uniref:protein ZNF365 n=1 Tax=Petromyzon marinus TaxID=7757 RepID=UPI003F71355B